MVTFPVIGGEAEAASVAKGTCEIIFIMLLFEIASSLRSRQ